MAQLAIRGHVTRGKEVIEILEMLGGVNHYKISNADLDLLYTIRRHDNSIIGVYPTSTFVIFTLEEFLEKFPYKVGDKVQHKGATSCGTVYVIERMKWANNHIEYEIRPLYDYNHTGLVTLCVENLQPYKEETMEKTIKTITIEDFKANSKEWLIDTLESMSKDDALQTICDLHDELHKPQFPTTYEECCKVLNIKPNNKLVFSNPNEESEYAYRNLALYNDLDRLKVCRDAYWVLADDWKPDWEDNTYKYVIVNSKNHVAVDFRWNSNTKLSFPTEEMRDAFYTNFKKLIEECKELL